MRVRVPSSGFILIDCVGIFMSKESNMIDLPGGRFELSINGELASFTPEKATDFGMYNEDGTESYPDEMYFVRLAAADFKKGDVVVGRMVDIPMALDDTDERTINMNGVKDGFTYGLGTVDLTFEPKEWMLFDTEVIENGFKLTFNGSLKEYPKFKEDYTFYFVVAWMRGVGDREKEIISFCTC